MYVFDTNVFVAALRSRNGASFLILEALAQGAVQGAASAALMLEYQEVLTRDEHLREFWTSADEVATVLGVLATRLQPVAIHFQWRPQLRDPKDEKVLECAINALARAIVTFNVDDFVPAASRFGIELLRPGEFVRSANLVRRRTL